MAHNKQCGCSNCVNLKVEALTLDDGRRAERHITVDEAGNELVEIFAEEKRPLKLEKRIVREMKNIVAKEIHETIRDGEVAYQEVHSLEPEVPLQVRSRMGLADHAKVVDGDYVRKEEIGRYIEDGVVAGITALIENAEPLAVQAKKSQPVFKSQSQDIVEKHVEEKKKNNVVVNSILGGIVVIQVVILLGYLFLM